MAEEKKYLEKWVAERFLDIIEMRYRMKRTLFTEESPFQMVDVVETEGFGKMLFNDGFAMISERDEFIYHEMIAHVPAFTHPNPRRALVIGGGDGGTVRELLRHPGLEHCRLVEIDEAVVRACREHIPQTSTALEDPRVEVTIDDGVRFVAETDETYDLVLVDSTDPIGPAAPLFGEAFYGNVHRVLREGGIVISQAESPYYYLEAQVAMVKILHGLFTRVALYNYDNMTYPGGLWSFCYACKGDVCPVGDLDPARVAALNLDTRYYNEDLHRAAFALPTFQRQALEAWLSPRKP